MKIHVSAFVGYKVSPGGSACRQGCLASWSGPVVKRDGAQQSSQLHEGIDHQVIVIPLEMYIQTRNLFRH